MYVVDNAYKHWDNGPECTLKDFLWHKKIHFIPWALLNKDLLESILFIACYNLSTLYPEDNLWNMLRFKYKGKCIKAVRDAILREWPVSDDIIALALGLVAEAVRFPFCI
jgi:hypothetical protein